MKVLFNIKLITFIISILLFSTNCQVGSKIEKDLYECILESYENKNIDFENELTQLENILIEENILENKSSKAYYKLLEEFYNNQHIFNPIENHLYLWENLSPSQIVLDSNCTNISKQILNLKDTKFHILQSIYSDSIPKYGDINIKLLTEDLLEILSPKDLKKPLYKMLLIWFWSTNVNVDVGITRTLPPPTDFEEKQIKQRNILIVLITEKNELFVNSEKTKINELKNIVKEFYSNPNNSPTLSEKKFTEIDLLGNQQISKGIVSLQNNRGVYYEFYIQVQNIIVAAINELRNEFAMQFFKKEFNNLNKEQQKAIQIKYPFSISEAEPK